MIQTFRRISLITVILMGDNILDQCVRPDASRQIWDNYAGTRGHYFIANLIYDNVIIVIFQDRFPCIFQPFGRFWHKFLM